jgi:hypothetical protein
VVRIECGEVSVVKSSRVRNPSRVEIRVIVESGNIEISVVRSPVIWKVSRGEIQYGRESK